jgi:hypothetical protein
MNISRNILNEALDLSMEWEHHNKEALSQRIRGLFPELNKEEASSIEKTCTDVKRHAREKAKVALTQKELAEYISHRYNFINKENLERVSRQFWFWKIK